MVFITTGQRIATENFADGVIYKVVFNDNSTAYMMCVGIGQDFVMLQGPNPSLFCLTMSSASRVSTIDIHDPTPPEPPTPIENALQYQTGEPPFTFTTTESSLFSWYIEGPCGVKTANLINIDNSNAVQYSSGYDNYTIDSNKNINGTGRVLVGFKVKVEPSTTYTFCTTCNVHKNIKLRFREYSQEPIDYSTGYIQMPYEGDFRSEYTLINHVTVSAETTWILLVFYAQADYAPFVLSDIMVAEGQYSTLDFEPYGKYKISILSNDNAETIYLDEALAEGERLYSVNIDTVVVTDIGENTISVTPTPPEMQIVYSIYAEA